MRTLATRLRNTLILLGHKLENATVTRDFDRALPRLSAYGGELAEPSHFFAF
jgi:hypothetical protein